MAPRTSMGRVFVRDTHPLLFRTYLTLGVVAVLLGLNFLFTTPTFNPYHLDYRVIGTVFLVTGLAEIICVLMVRRLSLMRLALAVSIGLKVFWGVGASFTFFQGDASLQLCICYLGMGAAVQFWLMLESPVTLTSEPIE